MQALEVGEGDSLLRPPRAGGFLARCGISLRIAGALAAIVGLLVVALSVGWSEHADPATTTGSGSGSGSAGSAGSGSGSGSAPEQQLLRASLPAEPVARVAAMGDSVTAGFAARATSMLDELFAGECDRADSWSGGERGMPALLRAQAAPHVQGAATEADAGLNVAVSGAVAADMPAQARHLVELVGADAPGVTLVTLFVGGNDACQGGDAAESAAAIVAAVDELRAGFGFGSVLVNLVPPPDVAELQPLAAASADCAASYSVLCPALASAAADRYADTVRAALEAAAAARPGVALRPLFDGVATPPASALAPDCFHWTVEGQRAAAVALWNAMLGASEPVQFPAPAAREYEGRLWF